MSQPNTLTILASTPVALRPGDELLLGREFDLRWRELASCWKGPTRVVAEARVAYSSESEEVSTKRGELPYELALTSSSSLGGHEQLEHASIVVGEFCEQQLGLAALCRRRKIPCVYTTGSSACLRPSDGKSGPVQLIKRYWSEAQSEGRAQAALQAASGLQAGALASFEAYASLNGLPILALEGALERRHLIAEDALAGRLSQLLPGRRLRLFSPATLQTEREIHDVLLVARELLRLSVRFELTLHCRPSLVDKARLKIDRWGLTTLVHMDACTGSKSCMGARSRAAFDLMLCCGRKGDLTGEYLEGLASGLPLVGYANPGLSGLLGVTGVGRTVQTGSHRGLAESLRELSWRPELLVAWSIGARRFALEHTAEERRSRRMDHLELLVDLARVKSKKGAIHAAA